MSRRDHIKRFNIPQTCQNGIENVPEIITKMSLSGKSYFELYTISPTGMCIDEKVGMCGCVFIVFRWVSLCVVRFVSGYVGCG